MLELYNEEGCFGLCKDSSQIEIDAIDQGKELKYIKPRGRHSYTLTKKGEEFVENQLLNK